jgi:uncharacterized protein (DUF2141 family)
MFRTSLLALAISVGTAQAADLTVTIDGIEDRGGRLYVSVQTEEQFMKPTGTAGQIIDDPEAGETEMTFDIPSGDYAVSVWHDFDGDGTFDMSEEGMPIDGWAISGKPTNGEPAFSDASVTVPDDGKAIRIQMSY